MMLCPICFGGADGTMVRLGAFGRPFPISVHAACVPRARELARTAVQSAVKTSGGALLSWARVQLASRHPVLASAVETLGEAFVEGAKARMQKS